MKEAIIQYNDTPSGGHLAISWKPLVRCKDCRWGDLSKNIKGKEMIFCYNGDTGIEDGYLHEPEWFCAEGIAKDIDVLNK